MLGMGTGWWTGCIAIALVAACGSESDPFEDVELGEVTTELNAYFVPVRTAEALVGNMVADAVKAGVPEADLVLVNGGSLRFDEVTRPDAIYPAGIWTELRLRELLRFDFLDESPNTMVRVTLTGAQLTSVLERSVSALIDVDPTPEQVDQARGWFLQVSGATYRADLAQQAQLLNESLDEIITEGARIVEVRVGGELIEPAGTYRVVVTNFGADGKDGHLALVQGTDRVELGRSTADYLRDQLQTMGPLSPALDGRIVIESSAR